MHIDVDLVSRSYPIYIDEHCLDGDLLTPFIKGRRVLVVTNKTIAPLYEARLSKALSAAERVSSIYLEDGEQYKTMQSFDAILTKALEDKLNRSSVMVALGGGVVGDMTGFASACYQRGIDFIQVPTTLLSQVDSSVGGKTGINHALGKNMIGAFHQPKAVLIDTNTLATLPDRELAAGFAEVIKYGLILDKDFFVWIEANVTDLVDRKHDALAYAIKRSCEIKAEVVKQDEKEQSGMRALLNLGHTFGHAIETLWGYGEYLHGEAVAIGTLMAIKMSGSQYHLGDLYDRTKSLYEKMSLPVSLEGQADLADFLQVMSVDKKNIDGNIRLILLQALGKAYLTDDYDKETLLRVVCQFIEK